MLVDSFVSWLSCCACVLNIDTGTCYGKRANKNIQFHLGSLL